MRTFILTGEHLALISRLHFEWASEGAGWGIPQVNAKRPFGNGDVAADVIRILGWEIPPGKDDVLRDRAFSMLKETVIALSIVCRMVACGRPVATGLYQQTDEYDSAPWVPS